MSMSMSTPRRSPPANPSCSGTLTQFSDEDEVNLLNWYLQMGRSKKKNPRPTLDSPTLDRIQAALSPTFSHSHIADKLHRLKLQYHKFARTKSFIKTPHHQRILDIGRIIWGKSPTPTTTKPVHPIPPIFSRRITQQRSAATTNKGVDLNNFPLLLSEFSRQFPGNGVWKKGLKEMDENSLKCMNQNWVLLHIQEADLKARRAALLHRQHTSED